MQKNKIISSLAYKFTEKILVKGLGLVIGIILARLLAPEIFGQLAILMVFINLSKTIIDGGLNTALVQKKDVTEIDYSVVYYLSTGVSIIIILGLFFLAPAISSFYNSPGLVWPLRAYSFVLLFGAFNSVQVARLQKQMRFRSMMWANLIATTIAGTLGIVCAYMGFGLWALVIYNFSQIVFVSITMLFIVRWFPKLQFSGKRAKVLFGFGWKMLVSSMLCSLYNDIRSLVIGKKYSTEDLGYYNKGQQFPDVISQSLDQSIQSVMFPAMASEQDRLDKIKNMFNRSLSIGALVIMPVMAGFALVAEPFVSLVLTEKWLPCVFFLQMCCIAYMATPLVSTNLILIKSLGKGNTYMILELIRRVMMLVILVCSIVFFDSVKAIAVGFVISTWLDVFFVAVPTKKLIGVGVWGQFKQLWKTLLAVALMSVATWAVSLIPLGATWIMLIQIVVGVLSYVGFSALLKVESFFYIWKMVKKLFSKKRVKVAGEQPKQEQLENTQEKEDSN